MIFRVRENVNDALNPLFLDLDPPNYSTNVKKHFIIIFEATFDGSRSVQTYACPKMLDIGSSKSGTYCIWDQYFQKREMVSFNSIKGNTFCGFLKGLRPLPPALLNSLWLPIDKHCGSILKRVCLFFRSSWLPFPGLGADTLVPWRTIWAPCEHFGKPQEQQDGPEGGPAQDFPRFWGWALYFESLLGTEAWNVNLCLGLFPDHFL